MLNNITNFFNLIVGRKIKTAATVEDTDLVPLGTRDPRFLGDYQPTAISVQDLQTAIGFNGVAVDNLTIQGDGTPANPLSTTPTLAEQVVLFADLATTEQLKPCTYNNGILGVGATLTGNAPGQLSTVSFNGKIDNTTTALGQIILVKNQPLNTVNPALGLGWQNGLYEVTTLGDATTPFVLTRTVDADTQAELYPLQVNVFGGATLANFAFLQKTVDPIVGTSNIQFTFTPIGIQNTPVMHVDTVTSAPLPACTYFPPLVVNPTLPANGAYLESNVNGTLGTINGVSMVVGRRIIVKDEVNPVNNGTYTVSVLGSASTKWRLNRIDVWGDNFIIRAREWKVNNPASTKYGARYSTNLQSFSNTQVGVLPITFFEVTISALPPWVETNGTDLTIWCNGQGNVASNTTYGDQALKSNTIGSSNTAMGISALRSNTIGSNNIAVGRNALFNNIDGVDNLAIGNGALEIGTSSTKLVAIGHNALKNNTTGGANTAIGTSALLQNGSGNLNTAVGAQALSNNNSDYNTAIGSNALFNNTTGQSNVAVGRESLLFNITGAFNTAVGDQALSINNGDYNVAVGRETLRFNSIGINNTAVGAQAALSNIDGSWNTTVGNAALNSNQSGNYNTAIGGGALQLNTASCNTAVGYGTLVLNTNGSGNVALGCTSLYFNTGNSNTGLGNGALVSNTAGSYNTAVGQGALNVNTVGDYNTAVGQGTDSGNFSGSVIIGKDATATGNNQFVVGSALTNAGTVTNAAAAQTHYWTVKINGTDYKILLGT